MSEAPKPGTFRDDSAPTNARGLGSRERSNKDTADLMRRLADQVEADKLEWEVSYGGNAYPMHTIKLIPRLFLEASKQGLI